MGSGVGAWVGSGVAVELVVGLAVGFVVGFAVGFVVGEGEADAEGDGEASSRREELGSSAEEPQAAKIRMQSIMPSMEDRKFLIINHSNHMIIHNSNLTLNVVYRSWSTQGGAADRKRLFLITMPPQT